MLVLFVILGGLFQLIREEVGCSIYLFICVSAAAVEWQSQCFATILLHHASVEVASVMVRFVNFRGLCLVYRQA